MADMRVLCLTIPERGHLHPLLPTLRRLRDRGHDVILAAGRDVSGVAPDLACDVIDAPPPPATFLTSGKAFAERLRDAAWLRSWIEALLIDAARPLIAPARALIDRHRPDVLVIDPMLYGAVIAAAKAGVPWAAVSSSLNPLTPPSMRAPLTDTLDALAAKRAALFSSQGVDVPPFRVADALSPWRTIAFSCDAYAPRRGFDDDVHIDSVGAPFDDDDVAAAVLDDDTRAFLAANGSAGVLYASFGSQAFHQPTLFHAVFRAADACGLRVIASVGDLIDDDDFVRAAPQTAHLVRFAPQLALLPHIDVAISHGGANSVVEALRLARPLVLLPLCNDQHLQAHFLERSGCGVVVDPDDADVEGRLRDAISLVRADACRARTQTIAHALADAGGPARAATLIEQLAGPSQASRL